MTNELYQSSIKEASINQDTKDFLSRLDFHDNDLPYQFSVFVDVVNWHEPFAPQESELKTFYSIWEAKVEEEYS